MTMKSLPGQRSGARAIPTLLLPLVFLIAPVALHRASATAGEGLDWRVVAGRDDQIYLAALSVVDPLNQFAGGFGGMFASTTDGGRSWELRSVGSARAIRGIHFFSASRGIVVGDSGLYLETTDRGASWSAPQGGFFDSGNHLRGLSFADAARAVMVGTEGRIFTTADGGSTWTVFDVRAPRLSLLASAFRGSVGVVAGSGGRAYVSTDAGASWQSRPSWIPVDLTAVAVPGGTTIVAAGENGSIQRSTDAGTTWSTVASLAGERIGALHFTGASNGFAGSASGRVFRTSDGGSSWSEWARFEEEVFDLALEPGIPGIVLAAEHRPFRSDDGGATWEETRLAGPRFTGIAAVGPDSVIVVGERGVVIRSVDHGGHWQSIDAGTTLDLRGIRRLGWSTWIIVGDSGLILRSMDFGSTWARMEGGTTRGLNRVEQVWGTAGWAWAVGDSGVVTRTNDGGLTWTPSVVAASDLHDVAFGSIQHVFLAGDGVARISLNGGATWTNVGAAHGTYRAVAFDYEQDIFFAGSSTPILGGPSTPLLQSTADLGAHWRYASGLGSNVEINDVTPLGGTEVVIAVGSDGRIFRSDNSGASWGEAYSPVKSGLNAVLYPITSAGYAAGNEGVVLHTPNASSTPPPDPLAPAKGATVSAGTTVRLEWLPPPPGSVHVRIQVSGDPTFLSAMSLDTLVAGTRSSFDFSPTDRGGRFYWRLNRATASGTTGWSRPSWFSLPGYRTLGVDQLQFREQYWLTLATNVQDASPGSFWHYQASTVPPADSIRLVGVCTVPPGTIAGEPSFGLVVSKPGAGTAPFAGVVVAVDSSLREFAAGLSAGDLIAIEGSVAEFPETTMHSTTLLRAHGMWRLGTAAVPAVRSAAVTDLYHGALPGGSVRFTGGEPLEGMIVELTDLVVTAVVDSAAGTFEMADRAGNTIRMADLSKWFTNGPHRDPSSGYAAPLPGDVVDTIRGLITAHPAPGEGRGYTIAPLVPGDIVGGARSGGTITGVIYQDVDGDGRRGVGESNTLRWPVRLAGGSPQVEHTAYPGEYGWFEFSRLDAGSYELTPVLGPGWRITQPTQGRYTIPMAGSDSVPLNHFGVHYDGSSITGVLFDDLARDGVRDGGDPPLAGWPVELDGFAYSSFGTPGEPVHRTARTDADGLYRFDRLAWGMYAVTVPETLFYFRTFPDSIGSHGVLVGQNITSAVGRDFGFFHEHKVRLKVKVTDLAAGLGGDVAWGIAPGASRGIWQADPSVPSADSVEGEFELPPRIFAILVRMFDARFSDPWFPLNVSSPNFGEGSWTDVRDFRSTAQVDTFLLAFLPSYWGGGGYPMRLEWSSRMTAQSFSGPVLLIDERGNAVDMRSQTSITVSDTAIDYFRIVSSAPNLLEEYALRWNLVSIAAPQAAGYYAGAFPSAVAPPFAFDPAAGYRSETHLTGGRGYWIKSRPAMDVRYPGGSGAFDDTIEVAEGWNLIAGPRGPLPASAVVTDPPGLVGGPFFGYRRGYFEAALLEPWEAYWVPCEADGRIILRGGGAVEPKAAAGAPASAVPGDAGFVEFTDAEGNVATIRLSADTSLDLAPFRLPPAPPPGGFDIRASGGRSVEIVPPRGRRTIPVSISSAAYPLSVRWDAGTAAGRLAMLVGGHAVPLGPGGSAEITDPGAAVALLVDDGAAVPSSFALEQNYPNPFNPSTTIRYALPRATRVTLKVFDILGRELEVVVDEIQEAGYRSVVFTPAAWPNGVYFYRITAGDFSAARKMVLLK